MIESIFVALSGMQGHQRGLNVVSSNVANLNTTGFRGSSPDFADVFTSAAPDGGFGSQRGLGGSGLAVPRTFRNMQPAIPQQTGRGLDLALVDEGFFVLQDENGQTRYTRDGRFDFNAKGELVARGETHKVMSRNAAGQLVPLTLDGLQINAPRATTRVAFERILSAGDDEHIIPSLIVFDQLGGRHTLKVTFRKDTAPPLPPATINWKVIVSEGDQEIATGDLPFNMDKPLAGSSPLRLTLALKGTTAIEVAFDFDLVTGQDVAKESELRVLDQDGLATGTIASQTFDTNGVLKITYSNGQTADGGKLLLAQIRDEGGLVAVGDSLFAYEGNEPVTLRDAGTDLSVRGGMLEPSNVDLTQQFSELILMQRGYQASSQVLSTANDMLQDLLQMRGGR
jgi:flagellar hook protein FlgE